MLHLAYALASPSAPILPKLPSHFYYCWYCENMSLQSLANSSHHSQAEKPNIWRDKNIFVVVFSELLVWIDKYVWKCLWWPFHVAITSIKFTFTQQRAFFFPWMPVLTWQNATQVQGRKQGLSTIILKRFYGSGIVSTASTLEGRYCNGFFCVNRREVGLFYGVFF